MRQRMILHQVSCRPVLITTGVFGYENRERDAEKRAVWHYDDSVSILYKPVHRFKKQIIESLQSAQVHGAQGDRSSTRLDRKSTRLNSSHVATSYAVFCLKKKTLR